MVVVNLMSICLNVPLAMSLVTQPSRILLRLCGILSFLALHKIRQGEAAGPYQGRLRSRVAFSPDGLDVRPQILNEDNIVINSNPGEKMPPSMKFGEESKRHPNHVSCLSQLPTELIVDVPKYEPKRKSDFNSSATSSNMWMVSLPVP